MTGWNDTYPMEGWEMCTLGCYCSRHCRSVICVSLVTVCWQCCRISCEKKSCKYGELSTNHFFVPIALEPLDPVCSQASSFLCELGQRMSTDSGDVRETAQLFQRLSILMQHFNSAMFKSSFVDAEIDYDE